MAKKVREQTVSLSSYLASVNSEDIEKGGNDEFAFYVNGVKIYAKGTNWKPLHPLTSIADKKTKEKTALKELVNLHCNMVRVWGGGMYEDSSFYDFCNENGIMIWQDFMFACEVPTDDKAYCESVKKEAVQIVKKYRNHPSLAVWCGDNEDDIKECDLCVEWISKGSNALPSDNVISRQILKSVTVRNDPYRSFIESSPYYSDRCYWTMTMRNPTVSADSEGIMKTSKEDEKNHGFGLLSIEQAVKKYDGTMAVSIKNGVFEMAVVLKIPVEN